MVLTLSAVPLALIKSLALFFNTTRLIYFRLIIDRALFTELSTISLLQLMVCYSCQASYVK